MNINALLLSSVACGAVAPAVAQPANPSLHSGTAVGSDKPHIIMIVTDQQRWDALGAVNSAVITPNLDALAGEGNLFSSCYTAAPSSTPARSGLLTGMIPWHHGMLGYGNVSEHYPCEMPRMLREQGYLTLGIGKMHWRPQTALHGFHATITDESGRRESPYYISDYHKWFYANALGEDPDVTGLGWNDHGARPYQLEERLHPTAWTGAEAVSVIEHFKNNQPLFLKISFARPHSPYDPPRRFVDMYEGVEIPAPAHGAWSEHIGEGVSPDEKPDAAFGAFGDDYAKNTRKHYYASVTFIDEWVGKIVGALKAKGMYDNAIICFVSDHGDMMGDHNHWRKTYAYEGSSHVPLIVKLPKSFRQRVKRGATVDAPVELRDLLPTFLTVSGLQELSRDLDGESLTRLLCDKHPRWRAYVGMEHATCYSPDNYWCAMTDGKIKYIWFFNTATEQLFDLEKDPYETVDVSGDARYAGRIEELRDALAEYLSERGEDWVKDGRAVQRKSPMLYSPNYTK